MFITSYGLFWSRSEVNWHPGKGARNKFRLLGHVGETAKTLRVVDFLNQKGIYILYNGHGPYYVGITKEKGFGLRLKDHCRNQHADKWDRFSWFGFCAVQKGKDENDERLYKLKAKLALAKFGSPSETITDTEALLIRAMGLWNVNKTKFKKATEWLQVRASEVDKYLGRL